MSLPSQAAAATSFPTDQGAVIGNDYGGGHDSVQDYPGYIQLAPRRHFTVARVTKEFISVFGLVAIDGVAARPGDEVAAICSAGVVCGQFTVKSDQPGQYGFMRIYRDDPETPGKDGAVSGDTITFRIWDATAAVELDAKATVISGTTPPTWGSSGEIHQINLNAAGKQVIPLKRGWNLISFSVKNAYYTGDAVPKVPMLSGINWIKVDSIADALSSIEGKYEAVRSFDAHGAHTFDPAYPDFSDLTYMAAGYGYWIKMREDAELVLQGFRASPSDSLELQKGWNLVGYWGKDIRFADARPTVGFPPDATVYTKLNSLREGFSAIGHAFHLVRSFDANGSLTFDPVLSGYANSLSYIGPGYGYWIKMKSQDDLSY